MSYNPFNFKYGYIDEIWKVFDLIMNCEKLFTLKNRVYIYSMNTTFYKMFPIIIRRILSFWGRVQ